MAGVLAVYGSHHLATHGVKVNLLHGAQRDDRVVVTGAGGRTGTLTERSTGKSVCESPSWLSGWIGVRRSGGRGITVGMGVKFKPVSGDCGVLSEEVDGWEEKDTHPPSIPITDAAVMDNLTNGAVRGERFEECVEDM